MRPKAWKAVLLVLVSTAAYAPALENGYVLDDQYMIADNAAIRDLAKLPSFFVSTPPGPINRAYYRPVMLASFTLDYALFSGSARAFHAMNILCHALVAFLVLLLLEVLLPDPRSQAGLLGALVFALHPVQGEVVYLINYRATTLATGFFLAALLHHVHRRDRAWHAGSLAVLGLLYFCSVASKEIGVTLPVAMLLHDRLLAPRARLRWAPYVTCALVTLVYFGLRHALCEPSRTSYFGNLAGWNVALTMLVVEAYALLLLFVPMNLAGTYDASYLPVPQTALEPLALLCGGVLLCVLGLAWYMRRRAPLVTFAILFYFLALAPTYQLIRLPILFGERFLYLPMVGFCVLVAFGLTRIEAHAPRLTRFAWGAGLVACLLSGASNHLRAYDWRDAESFWAATVATRPRSVQAHVGLATTLKAAGRCADALPHYEFVIAGVDPSALQGRPVYGEAASCYSFTHRWHTAHALLARWLQYHPDDTGFRSMLHQVEGVEARDRAQP